MSAKVKWWKNAWWVITHAHGKRFAKHIGATNEDKRAARRIAQEVNAHLALGTFVAEARNARPKPLPFSAFARDWARREVMLPLERSQAGHLAGGTARAMRPTSAFTLCRCSAIATCGRSPSQTCRRCSTNS